MSELRFQPEIVDDGSGIEMEAHLAGCKCSNIEPEYDESLPQDAFHVFWDSRFNPPHLHIQCFDCWQTYCPYQQCIPPSTAEVLVR